MARRPYARRWPPYILQRDEMPFVHYLNITEPMITKPIRWVFAACTGYDSEFATFMKWVKDNWTEERPPRFAAIIYDMASGWNTVEGGKYADELGVEFVGYEVVPFIGVIDTTTELLRIAAKEPDWLFSLSPDRQQLQL